MLDVPGRLEMPGKLDIPGRLEVPGRLEILGSDGKLTLFVIGNEYVLKL